VQARLRTMDIEVATDTPEQFAKLIQADYERWGRVIKASGFTLGD
jgi:tripartite-type tricarboxylate transporter receptor subunit TctC